MRTMPPTCDSLWEEGLDIAADKLEFSEEIMRVDKKILKVSGLQKSLSPDL